MSLFSFSQPVYKLRVALDIKGFIVRVDHLSRQRTGRLLHKAQHRIVHRDLRPAAPLRLTHSDRIAAMEQELRKMGAELFSTQDTVTVRGGALHGADGLYGHNDHRVVMALAVAAYAAGVPAAIGGAEAINKSWPDFFETVRALGGKVELTDE